jgi:hypothetical protein
VSRHFHTISSGDYDFSIVVGTRGPAPTLYLRRSLHTLVVKMPSESFLRSSRRPIQEYPTALEYLERTTYLCNYV